MPFPTHFGVIIQAERPAQPIQSASGGLGVLVALLRERGAILLRDYQWNLEALQAFADTLAPNALRYGGPRERISVDDSIQRAENGQMAISLHSELAFTPLRPDTALFACRTPAASGGRTLIGDGRRIWTLLSHTVREAFVHQRVRYHRRFPPSAWMRLFNMGDDRDTLHARLAALPDFSYKLYDNGILDTVYTTFALAPDTGGGEAFCNNVSNMVEAEGIPGSYVTFEDGSMIEGALRAELKHLLALESCPVDWQAGDILLLDNRRVMHGREAFTDPQRDIWVRFANFDQCSVDMSVSSPSATSDAQASGSGLTR